MSAIKRRFGKNEKGFSLVEMIVVIAIMIILISMLVPNVVGYIEKTEKLSALNTVKVMVNAMEVTLVEHALSGEVRINKSITVKDGSKELPCGALTSNYLWHAQRNKTPSEIKNNINSTNEKNSKKATEQSFDMMMAHEILKAVNSDYDAKNKYLKFDSQNKPWNNKVSDCCPNGSSAAIFAYSPQGGCVFAYVIVNGKYIVTYDGGDYDVQVVKNPKTTQTVSYKKIGAGNGKNQWEVN